MIRVVDTSVIIAVITNEPQKAALVARTEGAQLFAPASLPYEIGNAFSAMLRRGRITLPQVQAAVEAYQQIVVTLVDVDLEEALALAARFNIYAYDAYMIACALRLNAPLLTLDGGLREAARIAGVPTEEAANADLF